MGSCEIHSPKSAPRGYRKTFASGSCPLASFWSGVATASVFAASARKSAEKFISELVWREFYLSILWHFPEVLEVEFNPKFRGMTWPGTREHFDRWRSGETGFPIVDAAMRQLVQTGFMPNRVRMIVAMFLTKDLPVDWRMGESYFMQKLTDGEIASNNGEWQRSAGMGADPAPYFRILNPWTQTARFDPQGEYIKKWVPELRSVAAQQFLQPPASGERLASGYPAPIVDHAFAREEALEFFAQKGELTRPAREIRALPRTSVSVTQMYLGHTGILRLAHGIEIQILPRIGHKIGNPFDPPERCNFSSCVGKRPRHPKWQERCHRDIFGEHTRPRVWCSASRRTRPSGGTPKSHANAAFPVWGSTFSRTWLLHVQIDHAKCLRRASFGSCRMRTACAPQSSRRQPSCPSIVLVVPKKLRLPVAGRDAPPEGLPWQVHLLR